MAWFNKDGLYIKFGRERGVRGNAGGVTTDTTKVNEFVAILTLTGAAGTRYTTDRNNDGTVDGFALGADTVLPSGAKILSVDTITVETPAGGTNYAVGTYQVDGTADDADGLLTTLGAAGAQVGTALTADRYVTAVTTGTYTAGKIKVIVRYLIA